ncbi:MAG: sigma 54-interacting transcriptional regulator [Chromatiaceae bacterium]
MADILIVEDDQVFSELLAMHLEDLGHRARVAGGAQQARQLLEQERADAVLLDQQLPDAPGVDLLREIAAAPDHPPVIVITGVGDNTLAIEAMRQGAYDFIRKPMDELELDTTLANAVRTHRLTRSVSATIVAEQPDVSVTEIIGSSPQILDVCKTIGAVAARKAPVLITGESGTGKELVARAIHKHSGWPGRFLPINCSALAENLLESELFGHEKESFTGAVVRKEGKFELAHRGTLFLDELNEMPAPLQAKLLRVLQDGTFARVGGSELLCSDARIIAAVLAHVRWHKGQACEILGISRPALDRKIDKYRLGSE